MKVTLNVEAEIQERFGDGSGIFNSYGTLRAVLAMLINEAVDIHNDETGEKWAYLDEKKLGRMLTPADHNRITEAIVECFKISRPDGETDGDTKNETPQ